MMNGRATQRYAVAKLLVLLGMAGTCGVATHALAQDARLLRFSDPKAAEKVHGKLMEFADDGAKSSSITDWADQNGFLTTGGELVVEAVLDQVDDAALARLEGVGARVVGSNVATGLVTLAVARPDTLPALGRIAGVRMVYPVVKPRTKAGSVSSQAVRAMRVDRGVTAYGVTGAGQKVGILSDSFAGSPGVRDSSTVFEAAPLPGLPERVILRNARNQRSGDLPSAVEILRDLPLTDDPSDEGAGMGELVHDIAPGASMAFHSAFLGSSEFAAGIDRLRAQGCTVIVDDVFYLNEPVFQEGVIAQAARRAVENGVPFFSAVGNDANRSLLRTFNDANPSVDDEEVIPSGNDFHIWDNGTPFLPVTVLPFNSTSIALHWNQPFERLGEGAQVDLDLYLVGAPTLAEVRATAQGRSRLLSISSREVQGTTGSPDGDAFEFVGGVYQADAPLQYYLVIEHVRGAQDFIPQDPSARVPLQFRVGFYGFERVEGISVDSNEVGGPTIFGHPAVPGVVGVGAVPWYDTPPFDLGFGSTAEIDAQDFTARGGWLDFYFGPTGRFAQSRVYKPDVAATNGENTTFFGRTLDLSGYQSEPDGLPNFFGTSAAAPNAAAVALLMKEIKSDLTPAQITSILKETATPTLGRRTTPVDPETGMNPTTGAGLVNAEAALARTAQLAGRPVQATPTPTPVPVARQSFTFAASAENWRFEAPSSAFTPPAGVQENNVLALTTTDNTNTFGYFVSPVFRVGTFSSETPSDLLLNGTTGSDSLYRATFTLRSNVSSALDVPQFRLRASSENFEQSSMVGFTSATASTPAPTTAAKAFRHFFTLPVASQNRFRLYFEVLGFDSSDAASARLECDAVQVDSLSISGLRAGRQESRVTFTNAASNGWSVRGASSFSVPASSADAGGLRLGPAVGGEAGATYFGYWGSPESSAGAVLLGTDRLYRARFAVSSTATDGQLARIPAFRLRMNDASLNYNALVVVESTNAAGDLPRGGAAREYSLFFEGRAELANSPLLFAFDYLLPAGSDNDPALAVRLESLKVDSWPKP